MHFLNIKFIYIILSFFILIICCKNNPKEKKDQIEKIKKLYSNINVQIQNKKLKVKNYKKENRDGDHPEDPFYGYTWAKCYYGDETKKLVKIEITYPGCQISSYEECVFYPNESIALYYSASGPSGTHQLGPPRIVFNAIRYYFFEKQLLIFNQEDRFIQLISDKMDYESEEVKREIITNPEHRFKNSDNKTVSQTSKKFIDISERLLDKFKEGKNILD